MLMLAYRTDNFPFMRCARENTEFEPVIAQLQSYDYTALCNQAIFIAICNFPTDLANDRRQNESAMLDLGPQVLVNEQLRQTYFDEPIFHEVMAMEVYKALGVDLVVMHIVSALSAVIKLINAYEAEGRLAVRKGFKLPILRAMNFDPELQIEYSGQLAMAHECFYEFRESAKFIALLDLDDLLVTIKFASLTDALNAASIKHPMAPYFYVNKLESGILLTRRQKNESTKASSARNFMHKFRELILTKQMYNSEKLVLRPDRIDAFWVHFSRDYKGKHKPVQLSNDYMSILHLSKDIKASAADGYNEKFLTKIMNWPAAVNETVVFFNLVFIREIEKSVANANKTIGWHNGRHHGNHEAGHDTFVMLMLAYRTDNFPFMRCARENTEFEPVIAQLQSYDYTALCNQAIFIAICNFPSDLANDRRQNEGAMLDLGPQVLVNEQLRQTYFDEPIFHELVVRKADQTPRNLLICVSRIFAFEKWQLLLTAMEVYKALGVDLVVMHIVSALSAVIKLINAYEAEGRLAVRKESINLCNYQTITCQYFTFLRILKQALPMDTMKNF
uniref:Glycosyltransferase family 92 protein n=1 Tax=Globodera pallida TaxID=36090 RepID=A0A183BJ34_GLOPA